MGIARTSREKDLLEMIYLEMQDLKRQIAQKEERRIGRFEFAKMLDIQPETLDRKVRGGLVAKPLKDGSKSYWLSSYVQKVVKSTSSSDILAT